MGEVEDLVELSSCSDSEESRAANYERNKQYRIIWRKATRLIKTFLTSTKDGMNTLEDFFDVLNAKMCEIQNAGVKEFIFKRLFNFFQILKLISKGICESNRFNYLLVEFVASYMNFICDKHGNSTDVFDAVINDLSTTVHIIFSGKTEFVLLSLLKANSSPTLYPIYKKYLQDRNKQSELDLIRYISHILCFRKWKKIERDCPQLSLDVNVLCRVLPCRVPPFDGMNRQFSEITDLILFASRKANDGTRIMLENPSLDLDECIPKYLKKYNHHCKLNDSVGFIEMPNNPAAPTLECIEKGFNTSVRLSKQKGDKSRDGCFKKMGPPVAHSTPSRRCDTSREINRLPSRMNDDRQSIPTTTTCDEIKKSNNSSYQSQISFKSKSHISRKQGVRRSVAAPVTKRPQTFEQRKNLTSKKSSRDLEKSCELIVIDSSSDSESESVVSREAEVSSTTKCDIEPKSVTEEKKLCPVEMSSTLQHERLPDDVNMGDGKLSPACNLPTYDNRKDCLLNSNVSSSVSLKATSLFQEDASNQEYIPLDCTPTADVSAKVVDEPFDVASPSHGCRETFLIELDDEDALLSGITEESQDCREPFLNDDEEEALLSGETDQLLGEITDDSTMKHSLNACHIIPNQCLNCDTDTQVAVKSLSPSFQQSHSTNIPESTLPVQKDIQNILPPGKFPQLRTFVCDTVNRLSIRTTISFSNCKLSNEIVKVMGSISMEACCYFTLPYGDSSRNMFRDLMRAQFFDFLHLFMLLPLFNFYKQFYMVKLLTSHPSKEKSLIFYLFRKFQESGFDGLYQSRELRSMLVHSKFSKEIISLSDFIRQAELRNSIQKCKINIERVSEGAVRISLLWQCVHYSTPIDITLPLNKIDSISDGILYHHMRSLLTDSLMCAADDSSDMHFGILEQALKASIEFYCTEPMVSLSSNTCCNCSGSKSFVSTVNRLVAINSMSRQYKASLLLSGGTNAEISSTDLSEETSDFLGESQKLWLRHFGLCPSAMKNESKKTARAEYSGEKNGHIQSERFVELTQTGKIRYNPSSEYLDGKDFGGSSPCKKIKPCPPPSFGLNKSKKSLKRKSTERPDYKVLNPKSAKISSESSDRKTRSAKRMKLNVEKSISAIVESSTSSKSVVEKSSIPIATSKKITNTTLPEQSPIPIPKSKKNANTTLPEKGPIPITTSKNTTKTLPEESPIPIATSKKITNTLPEKNPIPIATSKKITNSLPEESPIPIATSKKTTNNTLPEQSPISITKSKNTTNNTLPEQSPIPITSKKSTNSTLPEKSPIPITTSKNTTNTLPEQSPIPISTSKKTTNNTLPEQSPIQINSSKKTTNSLPEKISIPITVKPCSVRINVYPVKSAVGEKRKCDATNNQTEFDSKRLKTNDTTTTRPPEIRKPDSKSTKTDTEPIKTNKTSKKSQKLYSKYKWDPSQNWQSEESWLNADLQLMKLLRLETEIGTLLKMLVKFPKVPSVRVYFIINKIIVTFIYECLSSESCSKMIHGRNYLWICTEARKLQAKCIDNDDLAEIERKYVKLKASSRKIRSLEIVRLLDATLETLNTIKKNLFSSDWLKTHRNEIKCLSSSAVELLVQTPEINNIMHSTSNEQTVNHVNTLPSTCNEQTSNQVITEPSTCVVQTSNHANTTMPSSSVSASQESEQMPIGANADCSNSDLSESILAMSFGESTLDMMPDLTIDFVDGADLTVYNEIEIVSEDFDYLINSDHIKCHAPWGEFNEKNSPYLEYDSLLFDTIPLTNPIAQTSHSTQNDHRHDHVQENIPRECQANSRTINGSANSTILPHQETSIKSQPLVSRLMPFASRKLQNLYHIKSNV